jgi:hypothetical protein
VQYTGAHIQQCKRNSTKQHNTGSAHKQSSSSIQMVPAIEQPKNPARPQTGSTLSNQSKSSQRWLLQSQAPSQQATLKDGWKTVATRPTEWMLEQVTAPRRQATENRRSSKAEAASRQRWPIHGRRHAAERQKQQAAKGGRSTNGGTAQNGRSSKPPKMADPRTEARSRTAEAAAACQH